MSNEAHGDAHDPVEGTRGAATTVERMPQVQRAVTSGADERRERVDVQHLVEGTHLVPAEQAVLERAGEAVRAQVAEHQRQPQQPCSMRSRT